MSIFSNMFPYSDVHTANLDWLLHKVKDNETDIDTLQTQVDSIDDTIIDIVHDTIDDMMDSGAITPKTYNESSIAFIGDSWTAGYNGTGTNYGFVDFIDAMGIFKNVYRYAKGGAGFATAADGETLGTLAAELITEHDNVDIIVVIGGVNDPAGTDFTTPIISICNALKTAYPHAAIYFGANINSTFDNAKLRTLDSVANLAYSQGCRGMGDIHSQLIGLMDFFTTDNYHLTQDGYSLYAKLILANIFGTKYPEIVRRYYFTSDCVSGTGCTVTNAYVSRDGDMVGVTINGTATNKAANDTLVTIPANIANIASLQANTDCISQFSDVLSGTVYQAISTKLSGNSVQWKKAPSVTWAFTYEYSFTMDVSNRLKTSA